MGFRGSRQSIRRTVSRSGEDGDDQVGELESLPPLACGFSLLRIDPGVPKVTGENRKGGSLGHDGWGLLGDGGGGGNKSRPGGSDYGFVIDIVVEGSELFLCT